MRAKVRWIEAFEKKFMGYRPRKAITVCQTLQESSARSLLEMCTP